MPLWQSVTKTNSMSWALKGQTMGRLGLGRVSKMDPRPIRTTIGYHSARWTQKYDCWAVWLNEVNDHGLDVWVCVIVSQTNSFVLHTLSSCSKSFCFAVPATFSAAQTKLQIQTRSSAVSEISKAIAIWLLYNGKATCPDGILTGSYIHF